MQSKQEIESNKLPSLQKQAIRGSAAEKESSQMLPAELSAAWF